MNNQQKIKFQAKIFGVFIFFAVFFAGNAIFNTNFVFAKYQPQIHEFYKSHQLAQSSKLDPQEKPAFLPVVKNVEIQKNQNSTKGQKINNELPIVDQALKNDSRQVADKLPAPKADLIKETVQKITNPTRAGPASDINPRQGIVRATSAEGYNYTRYNIPDNGGDSSYALSSINISGAPSGAKVTKLIYEAGITHAFVNDVKAKITTSGATYYIWNRYGGRTDMGYDDDSADDQDIYLYRTFENEFDGRNVNGQWNLVVGDFASLDTGTIDYFHLWIYYDTPSNQPPSKPLLVSPSNSATNIDIKPTLNWFSSSDPDSNSIKYKVYLGTVSDPPIVDTTAWSATSWTRDTLQYNTTYYWKVVAVDSYGATSEPSVIWQFRTKNLNHAPQLSAVSVSPNPGITSDTYVYQATYYDQDGDAPSSIQVHIDGSGGSYAHNMSLYSGSSSNGVYRYSTSMGVGSHSYDVIANDGHGGQFDSGAISGPTVTNSNSIPLLSGFSLTPTSGYRATNFVYKVTYYDSDNDAPTKYQINIDNGTWINMSKTNYLDYTYTDGVEYQYTVSGLSIGAHSYGIAFNDGKNGHADQTLGQSGPPNVVNRAPIANSGVTPTPLNAAVDREIDQDISWAGYFSDPDSDTLSYEVYFGTSINDMPLKTTTTSTSFDPGTLSYETYHYWQIKAKDSYGGIIAGPTWYFKTKPVAKANLKITVSNIGGAGGIPNTNGLVKLYDQNGNYLPQSNEKTSDDGTGRGVITFSSLPLGNYSYKVYFLAGGWGQEYWGQKSVNLSTSGEISDSFIRNEPYGMEVSFVNSTTGTAVNTTNSLTLGQSVKAKVKIKNPNPYAISNIFTKVRLRLSGGNYTEVSSGTQTLTAGQKYTFESPIFTPATTGFYDYTIATFSYSDAKMTDSWSWTTNVFQVIPAPIEITQVKTTDENGNDKTVFAPGDKIGFHIYTNHGQDPITVEYKTLNQAGNEISSLSSTQNYTGDANLTHFEWGVTIPIDTVSDNYTFRGKIGNSTKDIQFKIEIPLEIKWTKIALTSESASIDSVNLYEIENYKLYTKVDGNPDSVKINGTDAVNEGNGIFSFQFLFDDTSIGNKSYSLQVTKGANNDSKTVNLNVLPISTTEAAVIAGHAYKYLKDVKTQEALKSIDSNLNLQEINNYFSNPKNNYYSKNIFHSTIPTEEGITDIEFILMRKTRGEGIGNFQTGIKIFDKTRNINTHFIDWRYVHMDVKGIDKPIYHLDLQTLNRGKPPVAESMKDGRFFLTYSRLGQVSDDLAEIGIIDEAMIAPVNINMVKNSLSVPKNGVPVMGDSIINFKTGWNLGNYFRFAASQASTTKGIFQTIKFGAIEYGPKIVETTGKIAIAVTVADIGYTLYKGDYRAATTKSCSAAGGWEGCLLGISLAPKPPNPYLAIASSGIFCIAGGLGVGIVAGGVCEVGYDLIMGNQEVHITSDLAEGQIVESVKQTANWSETLQVETGTIYTDYTHYKVNYNFDGIGQQAVSYYIPNQTAPNSLVSLITNPTFDDNIYVKTNSSNNYLVKYKDRIYSANISNSLDGIFATWQPTNENVDSFEQFNVKWNSINSSLFTPSEITTQIGENANIQAQIGLTINQPGYLQVTLYNADHSINAVVGTYIDSAGSHIKKLDFSILSPANKSRYILNAYIQFRPRVPQGPITDCNILDIVKEDSSAVIINVDPPPVILTNNGVEFYTRSPNLTLEGTAETFFNQVLVNGSSNDVTFNQVTGAWSYFGTLSEGKNNFKVTAKTASGVESNPSTITVALDTTGPRPIVDIGTGVYTSAVKVNLTSDDSTAKIYYTLDGTKPTVKSALYSEPLNININTTLKYFAIDPAGNESEIKTEIYQVPTFTLNLNRGWNMISVPTEFSDLAQFQAIDRYNNQTKQYEPISDRLMPGEGYFIWVDEAKTILLPLMSFTAGRYPAQDFSAGWILASSVWLEHKDDLVVTCENQTYTLTQAINEGIISSRAQYLDSDHYDLINLFTAIPSSLVGKSMWLYSTKPISFSFGPMKRPVINTGSNTNSNPNIFPQLPSIK